MDRNQVREYWTGQARAHGTAQAASWTDICAMDMEVREILGRLRDGDRVLDVGCANGHAAIRFAKERKVVLRGLDYIPEMVASAKRLLDESRATLSGTVEFDVGDITNLMEVEASYDKVVVIRVLINLPDAETQIAALGQCAKVLKPGGILLLSEASLQGWNNLNRMREEWGLTPIPMPSFNVYLDEDRVLRAAEDRFELEETSHFSSTYFVGTRVLKPILARLATGVDAAKPDMEWNHFCASLPPAGDYGTQRLFVLRRRA